MDSVLEVVEPVAEVVEAAVEAVAPVLGVAECSEASVPDFQSFLEIFQSSLKFLGQPFVQ